MAARSDAATDRVSRTTAPSLAAVTVCAWAKIGVTHAGNLFHPIMRVEASGGSAMIFGFKGANGRTPSLYSGSSTTGISGTEVALSTYVFVAATMSAGAAQLFQGTTPGSVSKVTGTVNTTGTPDTVTVFSRSPSDGSEWLEGTLAGVRMWTAVLSDAEIAAESLSLTAVRTSGLWASWPFAAAALTDASGNSRPLTAGSTALSSDTDPALATDITGSGALTAPAAVAGGAGTVVVSGTGAATAPKAVAAGTGIVAVAGVGSATAPLAQAAGTGTVVVAGSGALAAPPAVAVGTGTVTVGGAAALTAPPASAFGTGGVIVTGSGALVAPPAVVTGSGGTTAIEGSGALAAPTPVVNGTGQVTVTGHGALVALAPVSASTVGVVISGSGAASSPAGIASGEAAVVITGTGTCVAPPAVIHGYDAAPNQRNITVTARVLPSRYSARVLPSRCTAQEV